MSKKFNKDPSASKIKCEHRSIEALPCLGSNDSHVTMARFNLMRNPYESTYDDFMEIWLQFGHVFLFSSVYPLAGNNNHC